MPKLNHAPGRGKVLSIQRLIAVAIIIAVAWGLFWLIFRSGLADPAIAMITPVWDSTVKMIEDPLGIDWGGKLMAIAAIMIPHLGMLFFIFDADGR